ncbi:MAG TPA: hypothetical protein VFB89_12135 [Gemmatimonadales bacterium]|nr:hypothetical protein [Gemmatimonadales bacterium]
MRKEREQGGGIALTDALIDIVGQAVTGLSRVALASVIMSGPANVPIMVLWFAFLRHEIPSS